MNHASLHELFAALNPEMTYRAGQDLEKHFHQPTENIWKNKILRTVAAGIMVAKQNVPCLTRPGRLVK